MKKNNQKGQALIELIIFLPIMFMFYSMISGFANAINGSINQQKIARAYFYYRVQNNSTIPKPDDGNTHQSWTKFGMFFIGWKDYFESQKPVAPCYRISVPMAASDTDKCEEKYTTNTSMYIRVQTVYGVCGATQMRIDNDVVQVPDSNTGDFTSVYDKASCTIQQ